ncbi:MAG TPA: hypothetical protein DCE80_14030, partial [Ignavibacteriales bacterium]|nr:hypothetical protein [Ignavibacteriales bacterium]
MSLKKELIYIDGNNKTNDIVSCRLIDIGFMKDKYAIKYKNNDTEYFYNANKVKIVKSAISSEKSNNLFLYLNQIAETVGLTTEEGKNILADSCSKITFIPEYSILANFLNRIEPSVNKFNNP